MYQIYREEISREIAGAFDAALAGKYSLFIDDRPTGTGKTYQLPFLTRIAEKHGIKRSFILTPQKEQRDEICSSYFLRHYQANEVIVISADGELFAREAVWTNETKQIISAIGAGDLIRDIERQIRRHQEGEKEYRRNMALENEKAGIIESERILGKYRSEIWKRLTKIYRYDPKKRCLLNRNVEERAFNSEDEAVLRRLFPMELDEDGQYKIVIMTFQKNLHGISRNTFDNLFFSSDITKDSAVFIDESDEFYKAILNYQVERALRSDVSLIELVEYIYRFIPKYSRHTQRISENSTISEAAEEIKKDIVKLLEEYRLFDGSDREYIRNLKLEMEDDNSIMIVQYSGLTSDSGKHMCIDSPEDPSLPAVIRVFEDKSKDKAGAGMPLKTFVRKALGIVDRTAGFIRKVAYRLYDLPTLTDQEAILNALSTMQFRDTFIHFMLSITIPEKGGKGLRSDKKDAGIDPFSKGITVTRFEDDSSHESLTRIRTLYIRMLPAYWLRAMIRNSRFVMLISATARMDAMNDFPRRYISFDDEGNNICYEMSPESRNRIQSNIAEMKKIQYNNTKQRVFISQFSADCIYDILKEKQADGALPVLLQFGVSSLSNKIILANGGGENLAFIIQQMIDVIRYRRLVCDETYVHEIYLSKGFSGSEISDVIRELGYISKEFADLFKDIIIGSIKAGNITFQSEKINNCRTDNIHIREGYKVFIISAYASGGRGYNHTVYNDTNEEIYNVSGISCKKAANLLPGVNAKIGSSRLLECACNLINGGYISNSIGITHKFLTYHLSQNETAYHRDFLPDDDLSPYKQTQNAILSQTIGRFRMNKCADTTTIHIDQDILKDERCLKQIQFEDRTTSYEMDLVLEETDRFYRNQFNKENIEYNSWNDQTDELCWKYTKHLLPASKNKADIRSIREYVAILEAMKIASVMAFRTPEKKVMEWLKIEPRLQKGGPVRITKKCVKEFKSCFWKERMTDTAMRPENIVKVLYEPLDFLSDVMPDGVKRIQNAFAPMFEDPFRDEVSGGQRSFSISKQGAGFLKGEIGERFAEEFFRYTIEHGAYEEFRVYPFSERLDKPFIYQYEDFDGILAPNVFWDAKNVYDDLLLLPSEGEMDDSDVSFYEGSQESTQVNSYNGPNGRPDDGLGGGCYQDYQEYQEYQDYRDYQKYQEQRYYQEHHDHQDYHDYQKYHDYQDDCFDESDQESLRERRCKNSNLCSSYKEPEVLWTSMRNKISRMPEGQMNYLIYFSTRFTGNKKPPKFYRPGDNKSLGSICRETGRQVTIIVISSIFTEEDAEMSTKQKHDQIMSVIGRKVFDRILKEMEKNGK